MWIALLLTLLSHPAFASQPATPATSPAISVTPPPFFTELARANVDNSKGATLKADEKSRAPGASVVIPAGALSEANEEVVFSFSNKLPGLPEKPGDGMSFVQNSLVFVVQTTSESLKKPVTLSLPYYNEQEITAAGSRVVMFNYWSLKKNTFEVLDAKPIPGKISLAKIQTDRIYPEAEYVSLRLTRSPGFAKKSVAIPPGWKAVPNADRCLKIDGPKPLTAGADTPTAMSASLPPEQLFEASFSNNCDYPIQATGCENKDGSKGCPLPKPVEMPAHSANLLTLSGFSMKDMANVGACRVKLADGTPVTYEVVLSSAPGAYTVCLIKQTEN
jgi:hypothetical protein